MRFRAWSAGDWDKAQMLRGMGFRNAEIGKILDRTTRSVEEKFKREEDGCVRPGVVIPNIPDKTVVPDRVWICRDEHRAALERRTFTQAFCGDPAPGYSMLDRRASHDR